MRRGVEGLLGEQTVQTVAEGGGGRGGEAGSGSGQNPVYPGGKHGQYHLNIALFN